MTKDQVLYNLQFMLQNIAECMDVTDEVVPANVKSSVHGLFEKQVMAMKIVTAMVEAAPADSAFFSSEKATL